MQRLLSSLLFFSTLVLLAVCQVEPDRSVLLKLYQDTAGSSWVTTWDTSAGTLCGTSTVTCWPTGKVRKLLLASNNLVGTLPTELGQLTLADHLSLHQNTLSGPIPTELGLLSKLGTLTLNNNQLSGSIPTELALLPLSQLLLDNNKLTGSLPSQISNHPNITVLRLTNNLLSNSLPNIWSNRLVDILLDFNQFTGTIPTTIFSTKLGRLRIQGNQLTGSIPTEAAGATSMTELFVFSNLLSGSIPSQLATLPNLQRFWGYLNNMTGPVPPEFGQTPNLIDFRLQNNQLSGSIPTQLSQSKTLQGLWLSDNLLSGEIPTELGQLSTLRVVRLAGNTFEGHVPGPLLRLPNLTLLQLSRTCLGPVEPYSSVLTNDFASFEVQSACPTSGPYPQGALALSPLVAYQFSSSGMLADSSSNGNNLVVSDAGSIYQAIPFGQYRNPRNTALQVQVTSSFAFRAFSRLNLASSFTVELLFITPNLGSSNDLFAFSTGSAGTSQVLRLKINSDGSLSLFRSTSILVFQTAALTLNHVQANHVALTFNSANRQMILYVNGSQRAQASIDPLASVNGNLFFFLSRNSALAIDEVAVYGMAHAPSTVTSRVESLAWCPPSACLGSCITTLTGYSCS